MNPSHSLLQMIQYHVPSMLGRTTFINLQDGKDSKALAKMQGKLFRLINQVKLRNFRNKPKFKYGYEIPKNFKHAVEIDKRNGNTLWQDATKLRT